MLQDVSDLAAEHIVALLEAGELLARHDPRCEAAGDVEHAERRNERRKTKGDGEDPVHSPGGEAGGKANQNCASRIEAENLQSVRRCAACQSQHRSDG